MADDVRTVDASAADAALVDDADRSARQRRTRQRLLLALAGVVVLVLLGVLVYWFTVASRYQSTDNAYVGASTAQISAQVSGLVAQAPAGDTDIVHAGDLLVVIDPADAEIALARAQAEYQNTLQRVRQYYAQQSGAAAQVAAQQAALTRAQAEFDRRNQLASTGAVSGEELTAARTAMEAARASVRAAQEGYLAQRALAPTGRIEDHPEALAARAALDAARLDLARTRITAPIDGVVVQNHVQVGQKVAPGAVLMGISPIANAYVDANFKESQLRRMRVGQPARLTSDLYGDSVVYHGVVDGIGGGTGSAFALIPAQNATGNWIKVVQRVPVRIRLDPRELAERPLRVGLSMRATIDVSQAPR